MVSLVSRILFLPFETSNPSPEAAATEVHTSDLASIQSSLLAAGTVRSPTLLLSRRSCWWPLHQLEYVWEGVYLDEHCSMVPCRACSHVPQARLHAHHDISAGLRHDARWLMIRSNAAQVQALVRSLHSLNASALERAIVLLSRLIMLPGGQFAKQVSVLCLPLPPKRADASMTCRSYTSIIRCLSCTATIKAALATRPGWRLSPHS